MRWQASDSEKTGLEEIDQLHVLRDVLQAYPAGWWLDPTLSRWWLCLHVDWKAYDEVAWQVQAVTRTLDLNTDFVSRAAAEWDDYFRRLKNPGDQAAASRPRPSLTQKLGKLRLALWPARQPPSDTPTLDVLGEASDWLRTQGYELLHLSTGGDEYLALPVRLDLVDQVMVVARELELDTYRL